VSLGRRRRATGRPEKCIFHAHAKKMGKNRSPEPVFELPAHFTDRVVRARGRPCVWAALWPDSGRPSAGRARAALRAATCLS